LDAATAPNATVARQRRESLVDLVLSVGEF
jgi:hypothetical protein